VVAPPPTLALPERELRCGRLLARVDLLLDCWVETKCRDCEALNVAAVPAVGDGKQKIPATRP
jgi:phage FluMu protein Com